MSSELQQLLDFARVAAHEGGLSTLGYYKRNVEIIDKEDGTPVTIADRNAEQIIRKMIEEKYPDHGIHGEEFGIKDPRNGSPYQWFIDPIDGTKSFIHGVPFYTTLLGLLRDGECVVGVIECTPLAEQVSAAKGLGATLNGRPTRVSETKDLSKAVVLTTDPRRLYNKSPRQGWQEIWENCAYPRCWGDAYGHLMVATGRADIMLDPISAPYDVSPMPIIMKEAGGAFFNWQGDDSIFKGSGNSLNKHMEPIVRKALGL
ncbi:MAG: inositol monophosphatase family protein [Candidatus Sumerlaeia bacterium]|nr:inositol monophosphatase family protein [Candidatus Sumerlaeia bacterium]